MVGTSISHYKVLEKIGQGGMGEVGAYLSSGPGGVSGTDGGLGAVEVNQVFLDEQSLAVGERAGRIQGLHLAIGVHAK